MVRSHSQKVSFPDTRFRGGLVIPCNTGSRSSLAWQASASAPRNPLVRQWAVVYEGRPLVRFARRAQGAPTGRRQLELNIFVARSSY